MAISIKASTSSNSTMVNTPTGIVAGDLILIFAASYAADPTTAPTGFTLIASGSGSGSYINYVRLYYKVAVGTEGNTGYSLNGNGTYQNNICVVIQGHNVNSPIQTYKFGSDGDPNIEFSATAIAAKSKELMFVSQMANGSNVPNFTTPSGYTLVRTQNASNYHRSSVFLDNSVDAGVTSPATVATSDQPGGFAGFQVWINEANAAPEVTRQTPNSYDALGVVTSPTVVSWTYADQESNTQYKYEISYREAGTTGTYTTITSANGVSTTSHTFAAGTFLDGKEYEWRLRLDDNQGGGWSPYYTEYFTAGVGKWIYGPPVTTASSTSVTTTRTFATYDFESGTQGWTNNNFFGTYADCTFTNSTTRPKSGTRSMEITWPTAEKSRLAGPSVPGFTIGRRYRIRGDIYVPAGSPNVVLDAFLQLEGEGGVVIDKDMWVSAYNEFTAKDESITFAIFADNTTNGTKVFLDNVVIESLPIEESGTYQIAVRTSDGVAYGAWSSPASMTVRGAPVAEYTDLNPKRVGSNINVSWKYRDIDSQPQTKYKIRYRKK